MSDVTVLLEQAHAGDTSALDRLFPLVYDELRALARARRRGGAAETLNTTALVHEAYARIAGGADGGVTFHDREHVVRLAARAMRSVIIDYARAQSAQKRGGAGRPDGLGTLAARGREPAAPPLDLDTALSVDAALGRLHQIDAEAAGVAELRYFGGLTNEETAEALDLSLATVKRRWAAGRAWLARELAA